MSQNPLTDESCIRSSRRSLPRSWGGTPVEALENPAHYLHLRAFPCKKCKGPVVAGWIGKREDVITRETNVIVIDGGMPPVWPTGGSLERNLGSELLPPCGMGMVRRQ